MSGNKRERISTEAQARAFLKALGIETDANGYQTSATRCQRCGKNVWVRITSRPFSWESDVNIVTFEYECRSCGVKWIEHDSD